MYLGFNSSSFTGTDLRDALTCGSLLHIATHSTVSTVFVAGENDADEQLTDQDVAALCTKGDLTTSEYGVIIQF